MPVYLNMVMLLNFLVEFLLILGTNRLTGHPPGIRGGVLASMLGGLYAGACLLPGFQFLSGVLWRGIFLGVMVVLAFGWDKTAIHRSAVFLLLNLALGGLATGINPGNFLDLLFCGLLLWLLCRVGFGIDSVQPIYTPVELNWQGRVVKLLALRDTGNTLRDPITGESILVCGADVGEELLGLAKSRFADPAGTMAMGVVPGMRLVPYHTVGQSGGMMLALRLKHVRIGQRYTDPLVAFAPQEIGKGEVYRMLTGGVG